MDSQMHIDEMSGASFEILQSGSTPDEILFQSLLLESVRLRIAAVKRRGTLPSRAELTRLSHTMGNDPLFSSGSVRGNAAQFNAIAAAIANLSFVPQGCTAFGLRVIANPLAKEDVLPSRSVKETLRDQIEDYAEVVALQVIARWGDQRPLTGYNDLKEEISLAIRDQYPRFPLVERVLVTGEVARRIFEPLLSDYGRMYGEQEVRESWFLLTGRLTP